MRCLALAAAWHQNGGQVVFLTYGANDSTKHRISSNGFKFIRIQQPYPHELDARTTLRVCQRYSRFGNAPWVVLDGYHFDTPYHRTLREHGIRLLVIDDTAHLQYYDADILLNQNITGSELEYRTAPGTIRLTGPSYVLLRNEFLQWSDWERSHPLQSRRLLVTMGGSDPDNVTRKVLESLIYLDEINMEITVIIGPHNVHKASLLPLARQQSLSVRFAEDVMDVSKFMASVDFAITAGGSTVWEMAYMALPSIALILADNQSEAIQKLDRTHILRNLGWHADVSRAEIASAVLELAKDQATRMHFGDAGRKLIDGLGAKRVLKHM